MAGMMGGLSPDMMQKMLPFLAGAGLREVTTSIERIMKAMSGNMGAQGKKAQAAGASAPAGMQPSPPSAPASAGAPANPAMGGQIDPQEIMQLMALLQARGGMG